MERSELYRLTGIRTQDAERLEAVRWGMDLAQLAPQIEGLLDIGTAPAAYRRLVELLPDDGDHLKLLLCYLEAARRTFDLYRERRIPPGVYAATMGCFPRFLREDQALFGRLCFTRGWWAYRQTCMSLFRIGALEYEFCALEGKPALAIHIPSDADFSPEAVERSLEQAKSFFQEFYPDYRSEKLTCNSWLLAPRLRPMLSPKSNILSFQSRFCILRENPDDQEYIELLFQVPRDTRARHLPERTSLQREVKTLLLRGGTVGSAYGTLNAER